MPKVLRDSPIVPVEMKVCVCPGYILLPGQISCLKSGLFWVNIQILGGGNAIIRGLRAELWWWLKIIIRSIVNIVNHLP